MIKTLFLLIFSFSCCAHIPKDKCDNGKRVGISHKLEKRKKYWLTRYPWMCDWKVVQCKLTYKEAQDKENDICSKGDWKCHPGGYKKPGKVYCVYTFRY